MILIDLLPYIGLLLLTLLIPKFVRNEKRYMFFLFLIFFVFSGFRYGVGWDYFNYLNIVQSGGNDTIEPVFRLLITFCNKHGYTQFFFVFASFFTVLLLFLMFLKESSNPAISIFVFLCIPSFFLNSLTLVRFFLAISLVFYACHYGYKKQYILYFALLILAFLAHRSAVFGLLTIPFVLLKVDFSFAINLLIFLICFALGVVIGSFPLISSIFYSLSDTLIFGDLFVSGESYMQDTGGADFSRTPYVFALINLINLFSFRKNTSKETKTQLWHYVTIYNIGCSLMFLFSFTAVFANRLSLFFTVFLLLIVPFYKDKPIPKMAIYAICIFVFFYELTIKASHPLFLGRQNCWLPYMMNFSL